MSICNNVVKISSINHHRLSRRSMVPTSASSDAIVCSLFRFTYSTLSEVSISTPNLASRYYCCTQIIEEMIAICFMQFPSVDCLG